MKNTRVNILVLLGLILSSINLVCAADIYLVRHFEKQQVTEQSGKDVHLTDIGKANAQKLALWMQDKKLVHLFSTNYQRTKQSIAPTANASMLSISLYNPRNLAEFAQQLKGLSGNTLVLGHSNTTGVLFGLLACEEVLLSESDYGDIFKVSVDSKADTRTPESQHEPSCERFTLNAD